ncbi:MAG: hypothetical protein L6W00_24535 [Lentisphaeria bacterium]|nr:MAG: hypothetical protein L6W00_24535 [Lentisphaeria bacterium]
MEQPIPHLPKPDENMPPDHLLLAPRPGDADTLFLNSGSYEDYPLYTNGIEEAFRNSSTWYHSYHARHGLLVWLISGEVSYRIEKRIIWCFPGSRFSYRRGRNTILRRRNMLDIINLWHFFKV